MISTKFFQKLALPAVALLVAVNMVSCSEDDPIIGSDLLKKERITVKSDTTLAFEAYTQSQEAVVTSFVNLGLLGNLENSQYGHSRASFAAQLRMPFFVEFNENATVDSIQMYLSFNNVIGDTTVLQKVTVFELVDDLEFARDYKSDFDILPLVGQELGQVEFKKDSLYTIKVTKDSNDEDVETREQVPLTINLPNSLGERFLKAGKENLANQVSFLNFFKGLYFKVEDVDGNAGIYSFNLVGSGVTLYYKNNEDPEEEEQPQSRYNFLISENSVRFNLFDFDRSGSEIESALDNTEEEKSVLYIQGMGGSKVKLFAEGINEYLADLKDGGGIAINKAELELFVKDTIDIPNLLLLKALDAEGEEVDLPDNSLSTRGLIEDTNKIDKGSYRFNISNYIQELVDSDDGKALNTGFVIRSATETFDPSSVILENPDYGKSDKRIKLTVTYTKL